MIRKRAGLSPLLVNMADNEEGYRLHQLTDDPLGPHHVEFPEMSLDMAFPSKKLALEGIMLAGSYPSKTKKQRHIRDFALNPSIENYLKIKLENPKLELIIEPLLTKYDIYDIKDLIIGYGFDFELLLSAIDGDEKSITFVSLDIMSKMTASSIYKKQSETSLVRREILPSTAFIDYFISQILANYIYRESRPRINNDLLSLLIFRLSSPFSATSDKQNTANSKHQAAWEAGRLIAMGKRFSCRAVAKAIGVAPSSISRWFRPDELFQYGQDQAKNFDSEGMPVKSRTVAQK